MTTRVKGECPSCKSHDTMFVNDSGRLTCSLIGCPDPDVMPRLMARPSGFSAAALELGELVTKKNAAYGNSFEVSQKFLELLYPNGVPKKAYLNMLTLARVFDKQMRIANDQDAFDEDPWKDIGGYAIIMSELHKRRKAEQASS